MASSALIKEVTGNIENAPSQTTDATWTWKEPQIRCPNCHSIVNSLSSASEVVKIGSPTDTAVNIPKKTMFNQKPTNTPTAGTVGAVRMVWRVESCGCQVSTEWAGAYKKEVVSRSMGNECKKVVAMTPEQFKVAKTGMIHKPLYPNHPHPNIALQTKPIDRIASVFKTPYAQTFGECVSAFEVTPEDMLDSAKFLCDSMESMGATAAGNFMLTVKKENETLHAIMVEEQKNRAKKAKIGPLPGALSQTAYAPSAYYGSTSIVPPLSTAASTKVTQGDQKALDKAKKFLEEFEKVNGPTSLGSPSAVGSPSKNAPNGFTGMSAVDPKTKPGVSSVESNKAFLSRVGLRRVRKLSKRKSNE